MRISSNKFKIRFDKNLVFIFIHLRYFTNSLDTFLLMCFACFFFFGLKCVLRVLVANLSHQKNLSGIILDQGFKILVVLAKKNYDLLSLY